MPPITLIRKGIGWFLFWEPEKVGHASFTVIKAHVHSITAITSISLGKASGPDHLSPEHFYYSISDKLIDLLTPLFQAMLSLHYVPPSCTHSYVLPIPKGQSIDFTNPSKYRGISLSIFSQIFESVLLKGFLSEIEEKIHPLQGGFRKGYGTSHTSFILQEIMSFCGSKCDKCYLAFLNAKRKAFDTVWHGGLFYKLHLYGLTDDLWFLLHY